MHTDYKSTSVLDHFVVSARLVPLVVQCQAIHSGDNLSRHSPILLQLNIGDIPSKHIDKSWVPRKPAWHKASVEVIGEYKEDLHSKLDQVTVPVSINCMDTMCGNEHHSKDRDDMVLDILCAVVESSHSTVPLGGGKKADGPPGSSSQGGNVSGWRAEVKPFEEKAELWYSIWVSSGKPNKGIVHTIMSKTRNQYHYAVRRTKRSAGLQKAKGLFEASMKGDMDLIKEMKG